MCQTSISSQDDNRWFELKIIFCSSKNEVAPENVLWVTCVIFANSICCFLFKLCLYWLCNRVEVAPEYVLSDLCMICMYFFFSFTYYVMLVLDLKNWKKNNIVFKQFNVFIKGLLKSHDPNQFTAFKSVSFTDTSNIHKEEQNIQWPLNYFAKNPMAAIVHVYAY